MQPDPGGKARQSAADLSGGARQRSAAQWRLCLLLTRRLCRRPWQEVVRGALAGGADCVQVREKEMSDRALLDHVLAVMEMAGAARAKVIVNDRADIALAASADGVHLGQDDLRAETVWNFAGEKLIIGVSTHDLAEADAEVAAGADYCGVGTMFASSLKRDLRPAGVAYLREFIARHPHMPHLAIGGITPANVSEVWRAGARGIAVSTYLCAADEPEMAAHELLEARASDQGPPLQWRDDTSPRH